MKDMRKYFKDHKAELVVDNDRLCMIDFRNKNGSSNYYVNFIIDKKNGTFIINGDLGNSVAEWYNEVTPEKIRQYISDEWYYIQKIQCATDLYTWKYEDVVEDVEDELADWEFDDDEWDEILDEISESTSYADSFYPTERLRDLISEFDADYCEWLYRCGRRVDNRVYLWITAYQMACEQLGI